MEKNMAATGPRGDRATLSESLYRDIVENCADAVLVIDAHQTILSANNSAAAMFGHPGAFIVGKPLDLLIPERNRARHRSLVVNFGKTGQPARYMHERGTQIHGLRADGNEFPVNISILKSGNGAGASYVAIIRDVTEQKQTEIELQRLADSDPLTGILNRRTFVIRAEREFIRAQRYDRPLSFAMIDIDNFKAVNDTYGHAAGDHALIHVVGIVTAGMRQPDVFGRWGGEEFALLLPETDEKSALITVQRLRQRIAETPMERTEALCIPLTVTVSIGVASKKPVGEEDDNTLEDMINRADQALYLAKRTGRNRACAIRTASDATFGNSAA
jgi:diguanylate cyclase (GGDEF)-like protein/PAS domain S-box-containing protein